MLALSVWWKTTPLDTEFVPIKLFASFSNQVFSPTSLCSLKCGLTEWYHTNNLRELCTTSSVSHSKYVCLFVQTTPNSAAKREIIVVGACLDSFVPESNSAVRRLPLAGNSEYRYHGLCMPHIFVSKRVAWRIYHWIFVIGPYLRLGFSLDQPVTSIDGYWVSTCLKQSPRGASVVSQIKGTVLSILTKLTVRIFPCRIQKPL